MPSGIKDTKSVVNGFQTAPGRKLIVSHIFRWAQGLSHEPLTQIVIPA
jgi:hypothetical protein